ncbi:hypothetical protein [Streptomyces sp. NPDC048172]|uniref:hypothetical protein n=1 Tax=Streptomyces sp. NPDC048172 TaxID=3365505 RepID=UPI003710E9AD
MRPPNGMSPESSSTPIYDSLYAEYRRLFRALPGDRSDEEELRFEGFGTRYGTGTGSWRVTEPGTGSWSSLAWQGDGHGTGHFSTALPLPPAPRDGHAYG